MPEIPTGDRRAPRRFECFVFVALLPMAWLLLTVPYEHVTLWSFAVRDLCKMSDIASDTNSGVYKSLPPRQREQQQQQSSRPLTSRPQQRPPAEQSRSSRIHEKCLRPRFRRQEAVKKAVRRHLAAAAAAAASTATGDAYDVSRLTTSTSIQSASSQQWYGMMRQVTL